MYCNVAWCGVVWCGVVWCGVVWCGVDYQIVNPRLVLFPRASLVPKRH